MEAIIEEISAMRALRHPYVCALFGVFEDDEFIYFVTEYAKGGELFKRIMEKEKFGEYDAAKCI